MVVIVQSVSLSDMVAIIAGRGDLPHFLGNELLARGCKFVIISLDNNFIPQENLIKFTHNFQIGQVGSILDFLKKSDISMIVFAGGVKRPNFEDLKLDKMGMKLVWAITRRKFLGDNNLLNVVIKFVEKEHFKVIGADYILPNLLIKKGPLTDKLPTKQDLIDIEIGIKAATIMGELDIGQAVIVENGVVLAVEGAEGTDNLIARTKELKKVLKAGVLVKIKKKGQEVRVDLPTIGVDTVRNVAELGLNGIAIEAGSTIVLDREKLIKAASELDLFIIAS